MNNHFKSVARPAMVDVYHVPVDVAGRNEDIKQEVQEILGDETLYSVSFKDSDIYLAVSTGTLIIAPDNYLVVTHTRTGNSYSVLKKEDFEDIYMFDEQGVTHTPLSYLENPVTEPNLQALSAPLVNEFRVECDNAINDFSFYQYNRLVRAEKSVFNALLEMDLEGDQE
ncbi:hypothetical protein GPK34_00645 [Secundilactobacillus kimchicus]|uniref:hypothetical protein n=1 Tax=Secundilactobacillus kimchicus TaxID=528209 RepID=UPI001C014C8F|nr:hypothetical protein [Secundilactobacillus kimchicus]MBT9670546.1 hypothetical protein [Secundilactobacillus kimchicus]